MNNPLESRQAYERFLYTLPAQFPSIRKSTIVFIPQGTRLGFVRGEIYFDQEFRLVVDERLQYRDLPDIIRSYGYEIWRGAEKLYWYDSQPHPDDATLVCSHPHHKHVPPDIKHHRIPAPQISFARPNLPVLIQEIESLLKQ